MIQLNIQHQRDFLTRFAYWAIIAAAVYLSFKYLLPISVPFILGILIAYSVVRISRKLLCNHKILRIGLSLLIYGIIGALVALLVIKGVSAISGIIKWIPELYERKLVPLAELFYSWAMQTIELLDPALISTLEMLLESLFSALKSLLSALSGFAVGLLSDIATGVPNLILSVLAMIFSTIFVVIDYERIKAFASVNTPAGIKQILISIQVYLRDTLFVVIRSYTLIMLLTFTELSILFTLFGIEHAIVKAGLIAALDILPILGTGGIMIPWAVVSFILGYTSLGIELLVTYFIVTVVRNYVEPRIVGAQLGLHPIITLISMFIGLRLFGFLGLFGLPVGISFLWKQRIENKQSN